MGIINHNQHAKNQDTLSKIMDKLSDMKSLWLEAASLYCDAIDQNPSFRDWCIENSPPGCARVFRSLEDVGRGRLDVRVAQGSIPFSGQIRRLSIEDQSKIIDNGTDLLLPSGETLLIKASAMTNDQSRQVIASDHIRNLSEQKAWIESQKTKQAIAAKKTSTPILEPDKKNKCVIFDGRSIPVSHVMDICRRVME
jgi:hypothetical protein